MPEARGEKIVRPVPRSRWNLSCAPSTLERNSSSLILSRFSMSPVFGSNATTSPRSEARIRRSEASNGPDHTTWGRFGGFRVERTQFE